MPRLASMTNQELKAEADQLLERIEMRKLLAEYPEWFIGGSYSYDLMCWRDLDIYVHDPERDLKRCFDVAYEMTQRLGAWKSRFTNSARNPRGFYWGILLGDERKGAWKLDLWLMDRGDYEAHAAYGVRMRERLTPATRAIILEIKEAYWQRSEYRDTVTSDIIYRAVFERGVRGVGDFERFMKRGNV